MKPIKFVTSLLLTLSAAILIGNLFQFNLGAFILVLFVTGLLFKMPKGVSLMAIQKEIWQNDIVGNLFKNNQFAEAAYNADQYVLGGAVVHVPNAGAPLASQKNATVFPITGVQRTDSDVIYPIDKYFQAPQFVQNVEEAELSYDKRQSIMGEQQAQLIQDSMDGFLYNLAWKTPAVIGNTKANYVLTTGAPTATDVVPNAVGSRKVFTQDVFSAIVKAMNAANIAGDNRIALLTAYHHQQFLDSLSDAAKTGFNAFADMKNGVIGMFLGFKFMMRSTVQYWRNTAGVWAPVDTQAAGFTASDKSNDSAASLIYQASCIERARGDVKVFDNADRAEYYGDLMSCNMRFGGRQRRSAGVWAVIEDIAA